MDLIDRQAAIDALEEGFKDATEGVDKLSPTYGLIKAVTGIYKCLIGKLPSAQPEKRTGERTETHACDSISRQAAIEKILGQPPEPHYPSWYAEQIKKLPPAEPKRGTTTLRIGRTRNSVIMWYECDACGEPVDQNDCYCRKCGRKLKHE